MRGAVVGIVALGTACGTGVRGGGVGTPNNLPSVDSGTMADGTMETTAGMSICNGSNAITLGYFRADSPHAVAVGAQVVYENGTAFLYVNGSCDYWVFGYTDSSGHMTTTQSTRQGHLSADLAASLEADTRYRDWVSLKGRWHSGAVGSSGDTLTNGAVDLVCDQNCTWSGAPAQIAPLFASVVSWVDRLASAGHDVGGSVRVLAADVTASMPTWRWAAATWPLSTPLTAVMVTDPTTVSFGQGHLLTGDDAIAVRNLRDNQHAEKYSPLWAADFVPVREPDGGLASLFVRDDLPNEDANGLIRLP